MGSSDDVVSFIVKDALSDVGKEIQRARLEGDDGQTEGNIRNRRAIEEHAGVYLLWTICASTAQPAV